MNIYHDDLTLNGNADPLAGGLALLQKKFSPLELNKDKSTIWTNLNGLSHNSNIVERTGLTSDEGGRTHQSSISTPTSMTATTATLPLDSERPVHNETAKTELNILLDKRTDFIKTLMTLTESGLPIHCTSTAPRRKFLAKQLFIPMREGGVGLASAELQAEPAMMPTCEITWVPTVALVPPESSNSQSAVMHKHEARRNRVRSRP